MRINNNITAINSHRQYTINNTNIAKNVEKLSSGYRVNRAADDAAGLAISEKMRAQIRGLNMASKNSQDAISLVQVAEGGMQTIQDILQRMRELSVQAASDTNVTLDRSALDLELQQLIEEIDQIAKTSEFNEMKLLDGNFKNKVIQAGANVGQTMSISISAMSAVGLKVNSLKITTRPLATAALAQITLSLNSVSMQRATLGAYQNRLEYKIKNLDNAAENLSAAESRIRDVDMAKMMTEFTKNNILFQASTAMLAQANALPQGVLQLLG
ncbi:MAG: flagellin [Oscillospiraceae bacterium]|nr:flagellin [Oscillospiraceae bacterium]